MRRTVLVLLLATVIIALAACSSTPRSTAVQASSAWQTKPNLPVFVDHSVGQEEVSIQAMSLVGVPYRWGGNTPDSGFDCSGLVRYVVTRATHVRLPRTTNKMSMHGSAVEPGQVAPGDLIFFNTTGQPHSHVGIYVGKYRFVNAPSRGGTVRIDSLTNPYWARRFDGIRRVDNQHGRPLPSLPLSAPVPPALSSSSANNNLSDDPIARFAND